MMFVSKYAFSQFGNNLKPLIGLGLEIFGVSPDTLKCEIDNKFSFVRLLWTIFRIFFISICCFAHILLNISSMHISILNRR